MMKSVYFALFSGYSFISKLIQFWTRSKRSHSAFVNPEIFDGTIDSLYKDGALIEAWAKKGEPFYKLRTIKSSLKNHSPKTPFTIYELKVSDDQYHDIMNFQNICAYLEIPYDWRAIIAFVLPMKLKRNGYLFCSEKDCLSLKYAKVIPENIPCWKMSPDLFEDLLLAHGAKKVGDFIS